MIRYNTSASGGEMDTIIGSWSSPGKTADLPHTSPGQVISPETWNDPLVWIYSKGLSAKTPSRGVYVFGSTYI